METEGLQSTATEYAPAERATEAELRAAVELVCSHPVLQAALDALSALILVLNRQRQIVALNDAVLDRLGFESGRRALGLRPGELLECTHADAHEGGCGTSIHCALCGVGTALFESQDSDSAVQREFRITVRRGDHTDAAEFEVVVKPFEVDGEKLTLVSLRDISEQRRLEMLEHTFFHDVLGSLAGIRGWADILVDQAAGESTDAARRIHRLVNRLGEQVEYQRAAWRGASGELQVNMSPVSVFELVEDLSTFFREHPITRHRQLKLPEIRTDAELVTDRQLLLRVLANMLLNAFEATDPGGSVRLSWDHDGGQIVFSVWNDTVMPEDVMLRVFTRSFSTKAERGRGLGTYTMKLFGERYLGGRVAFSSADGQGTTFTIALSVDGPANKGD